MAKIRLAPAKAQPDNLKTRAVVFILHAKWFYVSMMLLTYIIIRELFLWVVLNQ